MAKVKLAKIIYKKLKNGKDSLEKSHAVYGGKRFELDELVPVQVRGEKGKLLTRDKFRPRVVEEKRLADLATAPGVNKKRKTSLSSDAENKNKYIMNTLESMPDKQLFRLTVKEMDEMFGRNVSSQRKRVLNKRINPATGKKYESFDMPLSAFGRHYNEYDKFDNPIVVNRKLKSKLGLKEKNYNKIIKLFNDIDLLSETKTPTNSRASLFLQIDRAIKNSKLPEDETIENIIGQVDKSAWGKLLRERNIGRATRTRAEKAGILKKSDRPEVSHIIPVSKDLSKALDTNNVFYEPQGINRARPKGEVAQRRYNYIKELDDSIIRPLAEYDLMDKYSLSKGGLIKDVLSGAAQMSRRKFLKGSGALAASTALPMRTVAKVLPKVAVKEASRFAPPWVKSMIGVLDQIGTKGAYMSHTMKNGTKISSAGKVKDDYRGQKQEFEVINSDGYRVPVNLYRPKNGDLHVEFDIRDDFQNNQHIYMDRKTGQVEIVDENYYMTGPEDFAKDDPLVWDVTTPTQMSQFEKKMGLMRGDGDDYIKDYMSTPEGGDYSDLFESFIDSFSPSGSIFKTKEKAQIAKDKKIQQTQRKLEDDEMRFEEEFRGGNIHSFNRGGSTDKIVPKFKPDQLKRYRFMNNLSDQEAMARMMMAEDSSQQGGYGVAHVINNRLKRGHSNYGSFMGILPQDREYAVDEKGNRLGLGPRVEYSKFRDEGVREFSDLQRILMGYDQFTPFRSGKNSRFFGDYTGNELDLYNNYYDYAGKVLGGNVEDFTGGADFFHKAEENPSRGFGGVNPTYFNKFGGTDFYKSYNSGGIARRPGAVPPEKGPDPLGYSIKNMGEQFIKKAKGGLLRKIPKVMGKITDYKAKLEGPSVQGPIRPDKPFTVFDEDGLPIKDFDTGKEARDFLRNNEYADMYTAGAKKAEPIEDTAGAMFWNSREKIVNAPSEAMQANQWLDFMKRGKHGILNPKGLAIIKDQELNDTSLAPYLSQMGKQIISKEKLVKEFDEMAPTFDVIALGDATGAKVLSKVERSLNKIDTQAIRNPQVKGFFDYMKTVINPLQRLGGDADEKAILSNKINEMVERNFGIKNALEEGVPQRFPFEVKEVLSQVSTALGKRTSGFSKYDSRAIHEGTQTLSGGDNYREFLFTHKPGKLRSSEPNYTYAHDFGLSQGQRAGGVVHTRVSDRTDQFGRRLMHIEEIQSDMHQKINMAQRALKKQHAEFEKKGLTPKQGRNRLDGYLQRDYDELVKDAQYAPRQDVRLKKEINANEQQMRLIQAKIEDLLTKPQNKATQIRLVRLNKERAKIRRILEEEKSKLAENTNTTGIPEGPLRKSEDYNEFVMKYLLRVAEEGGYDGLSISTPAIKNLSLSPGSKDFIGNLTAYGPIANGAMKKAAKKVGAKFMKTAIVDEKKRGWEIPMILIKENKIAKDIIKKGTPIYKKGGSVKGKK